MFGLAIIFFIVLYIVIWVLVIIGSSYFGFRFFKSKKAMIIFGLVGFLVGYWPAFGDLIPTLRVHKELCEKEAGFKVYITPDMWNLKNPGMLESLVPYNEFTSHNHIVLGNERIGIRSGHMKIDGVPVTKHVKDIIDVKNNEILAKDTDFSRGYGSLAIGDDNRAIKFWLHSYSCYSDQESNENYHKRLNFYKSFKMEK